MILKKLIVIIALLVLSGVSLTCAQSLSDLEREADFGLWLQERGHLFEVEYKAGLDPMRIDKGHDLTTSMI